jgi:hypothetical protein
MIQLFEAGLPQRYLARTLLQGVSDFQQAVEHLGTFGTACGELRVGLFVHVLQAVKLIGNMQGGQYGYL